MTLDILHRGPRYCVRHLRCSDAPWTAICFEYWKPEPTLEGEFSAEGFLRHRGLNGIGILAAENDWFLHPEIDDALDAIRRATNGHRLVAYAGSMGAHASLNYADALGIDAFALVIPQFSIDPAKAPYETRWREEASRLDFTRDRIADRPPVSNGWILFDPWCVDARHVADIQRRHRLTELRVPFGGHAQMLMLQQANVFTQLVIDMLDERFDAPAFRRAWRAARRGSAAFWLGVARTALTRGNPEAALRALDEARALPHPSPQEIEDLATACLAARSRGFPASDPPALSGSTGPEEKEEEGFRSFLKKRTKKLFRI